MKFRYKAEDFEIEILLEAKTQKMYPEHIGKLISSKANALLETYEKSLPRVYGVDLGGLFTYSETRNKKDTHTALLWGIMEIKE